MPSHCLESPTSTLMWQGLRPVMEALLKASDCAADTDSKIWDFAISIRRLLELGASETDLRWLTRKGYIAHGMEMTVPGDDGRAFRSVGNMTFCRRTCFILTEAGTNVLLAGSNGAHSTAAAANVNGHNTVPHGIPCLHDMTPDWDADLRRLRLNGELVKRFKWPAVNQEAVLCVFQEEGWPCRIDDPLPPQAEQDPKRRLADTIKCLNRKQIHQRVHFRGDGTGEGVIWELVEKSPVVNGTS